MKQQLLNTLNHCQLLLNNSNPYRRLHIALLRRLVERMDDTELNKAIGPLPTALVQADGEYCPHGVLRVATCLQCARDAQQPPPKGA
jgi:hypothetical protein